VFCSGAFCNSKLVEICEEQTLTSTLQSEELGTVYIELCLCKYEDVVLLLHLTNLTICVEILVILSAARAK
jgi:hypothetical protein